MVQAMSQAASLGFSKEEDRIAQLCTLYWKEGLRNDADICVIAGK